MVNSTVGLNTIGFVRLFQTKIVTEYVPDELGIQETAGEKAGTSGDNI